MNADQDLAKGEVKKLRASGYQYSNKPASWPRAMLAAWRILKDPEAESSNVKEAAIFEVFINQSKFGKKLSRWDLLAEELAEKYPEVRAPMKERRQLGLFDIDKMLAMPEGSLGREYAEHAVRRGINPNLLEPVDEKHDGDWLMNHLYATHDFHHLLTGFYYDMRGEFGVTGFYLGQMPKNTFLTVMVALLLAQRSWKHRDDLPVMLDAFTEGYAMGKRAKCIIGMDYDEILPRDMGDLRVDLGIDEAGTFPEFAIAAE